MIQDIYPHQLFNQFDKEAVAGEDDLILNIREGKILVRNHDFEKGVLSFPRLRDLKIEKGLTYLFKVDEERFFLCTDELSQDGYIYIKEKEIRERLLGPAELVFAAITGKHLADWYRDNKFCGRCGGVMTHSNTERAMTCQVCHYTSYPRIMPAVIVGVINKNKMLITKYRTGFAHNALIAGFTEIGETVEETVAREVMEETGVRVKNIRYYKSQPWGSANDILLGFYCDLDGDETITMDAGELKYAQWVERDEIELQPGSYSLTNEMMREFKKSRI